jgi:hypothetical protein
MARDRGGMRLRGRGIMLNNYEPAFQLYTTSAWVRSLGCALNDAFLLPDRSWPSNNTDGLRILSSSNDLVRATLSIVEQHAYISASVTPFDKVDAQSEFPRLDRVAFRREDISRHVHTRALRHSIHPPFNPPASRSEPQIPGLLSQFSYVPITSLRSVPSASRRQ